MSTDEGLDSRTASFDRKRIHAEEEEDDNHTFINPESNFQKRIKSSVHPTVSKETPLCDDLAPSPTSGKHGPLSSGSAPSINWNLGTKAKIRTTLGGSRAKVSAIPEVKSESKTAATLAQVHVSSVASQVDSIDGTALDDKDREQESNANSVHLGGALSGPVEHSKAQSVEVDEEEAGSISYPPSEAVENTSLIQDGADSDGDVVIHLVSEEESDGYESGEVHGSDNEGLDEHSPKHNIAEDKGLVEASDVEMSSEGEEQRDAMMDYSNANLAPTTSNANEEAANKPTKLQRPPKLADLSPEDLELQFRYFYVTQNPRSINLNDPAKCLICAQPGHTSSVCSALTCSTCGLHAQHFTSFCPKTQKCQRCQERGHPKANCPYKLARIARIEIECDLCEQIGHTKADCELLWRTSGLPWETDFSSLTIHLSCYECGQAGHMGNDCPTRNPRKPMGSSTWSIHRNSKAKPVLGTQPSHSQITIKGRATSKQNQPIQISDGEDDPANFVRLRIPPPPRSGQIQIRNPKPGPDSFRPPAYDFKAAPRGPPRSSDPYPPSSYQSGAQQSRRRSRSPPNSYKPPRPDSYMPPPDSRNAHYRNYDGAGDDGSASTPKKKRGKKGKSGFADANPQVQMQMRMQAEMKAREKAGKGGESYRPLPSAAQRAWKKGRT